MVYQCPDKGIQIPTDLSVGGDNVASAYVLCPLYSFVISISGRGRGEQRLPSQGTGPQGNLVFGEDFGLRGFVQRIELTQLLEEPGFGVVIRSRWNNISG